MAGHPWMRVPYGPVLKKFKGSSGNVTVPNLPLGIQITDLFEGIRKGYGVGVPYDTSDPNRYTLNVQETWASEHSIFEDLIFSSGQNFFEEGEN